MNAEAGRKCEVSTRRAAHDGEFVDIRVKKGRPFGANPAKGVFEVFDDAGQLGFGSQTIVDRNDGIASAEHHVFNAIGDASAVAIDECAAVNPNHDRARRGVVGAVDIGLDSKVTDGLARYR